MLILLEDVTFNFLTQSKCNCHNLFNFHDLFLLKSFLPMKSLVPKGEPLWMIQRTFFFPLLWLIIFNDETGLEFTYWINKQIFMWKYSLLDCECYYRS